MADWNDVLTVLNHDPAIRSWTPFPGDTRAAQLTVTTENNEEVNLIVENTTNEYWLQIISPLFETADADLWKAAAWHLRNTPTIGLAQIGDNDGIAIRHGILLPHATIHAITNGINLTAIATAIINNAANT